MTKSDKLVQEKLKTAVLTGAQLLIDNNLGDWKIKINNKRKTLAETWHTNKTISFSKRFILVADKDQFEGVTLHEVTHALLGAGYGHGKEFIDLCTKISSDATYAVHGASVPIGIYTMTCPECGYSGTHNIKKELYCGICAKDNKMIKFNVEKNNLKVKVW